MSYQRAFFLEGQFKGIAEVPATDLAELASYRRLRSTAYFCPTCGEVWARLALTYGGEEVGWEVLTSPCRKHPESLLYPAGSLISFYLNPQALELLPPDMVSWEFDRHLDYMDYLQTRKDGNV